MFRVKNRFSYFSYIHSCCLRRGRSQTVSISNSQFVLFDIKHKIKLPKIIQLTHFAIEPNCGIFLCLFFAIKCYDFKLNRSNQRLGKYQSDLMIFIISPFDIFFLFKQFRIEERNLNLCLLLFPCFVHFIRYCVWITKTFPSSDWDVHR